MQFSKHTIDTLKNFAQINPEIVLDVGKTIRTKSPQSTIYATSELPDDITARFGITDLHGFLDLLVMMGPEAEVLYCDTTKLITLKNNHTQIYYFSKSPDDIDHPKGVVNLPEPKLEFNVKGDQLNQMMKIAKKTGVNAINIQYSKDTKGFIQMNGYRVAEIKRTLDDPQMFSMDIAPCDDPDMEFKLQLNVDNMIIPYTDYKVSIYVAGPSMLALFENEHSNYGISIEADSSHNFDN